jgi:hypothetical protein
MSTAPSHAGLASPVASWRSVFAIAMVSQACLFWRPGFGPWLPDEYPTTFSGLYRNGEFYAGSVSHGGFVVHPSGFQPPGFRLYLGWGALSWTCPYWLMTVAWLLAFYRTRGALRFNLRDALAITGLTAISLGLIHLQVALVATTLLNLATAALLTWFVARSIARALWVTTRAESLNPVEV